MKKRLLQIKSVLLFPIFFLLLMAMSMIGQAQVATQDETPLVLDETSVTYLPTVITNKTDYAPGETVTIDGTHFEAGESVSIVISHIEPNMPLSYHSHELALATADANGSFTAYWYVNEVELNTTLLLIATGDKGSLASTVFTDAASTKILFSSAEITGTSTICSGNTSTLNLSITSCTVNGTGDYSISAYKWQQSNNNTSWTDASGTNTNSSYIASPTSNTYYHCIITLSGKKDNCDGINAIYTTKPYLVTFNSLPNNVSNGFSGGNICVGNNGTLTFDADNTGFVGPYTIVYSDGATQWEQTINTADATTFNVALNPTSTTNYTLLKITNANGCERTSGFGKSVARITVYQLPTVSCPTTFSASSCSFSNQTDVDAAYATWLATASATNGTLTNNNNGAPAICGGTKTVTFTSTSNSGCGTTSCDASFIITPAKAVAVTGPATIDATSCTYASQTDVDAAFAAWIAAFKVKEDGCGILAQTDLSKLTAPNICTGGTVAVKFDANDKCTSDTYSASFVITPAPAVAVEGPAGVSKTSCDYAAQTDVDAAFATWIAAFKVKEDGCGILAQTDLSKLTAPNICTGGTVAVKFDANDKCTSDTYSASFVITPAPAVAVEGPAGVSKTSCDYAAQTDVDAAFATWIAAFKVKEDGCGILAQTDLSKLTAPNICTGGTVAVKFDANDKCTSDTYSASFVITPAPAVAVEGPAGVSKTSCDYAAQTDVDAAFATWIAAFKVKEDGCGILAQTDLSKLTAPNICTGGTVAVKFDANDKCTSDTYSASFVITPAPAVAVEGPAGVSKTSCDYAAQTDVDAAFATWIAAFKVKEDGCGILAQTDLSKLTAPNICTGGTVAVKFDANDKCTSDTYSASFVITPAPAVAVEGPAGVSKTSCDYAAQTDVDAAFATWIAAFKVKEDGCGILAQTDLSKLTAPNICTGGTVAVKFDANDKCTSDTYSASFVITPAPAVAVEGPAGVSKTSCDYAAQTDVDAAFATWIAAFKVKEDGCGILAQTDLSKLTAPNICTGGTVAVKFDANDKCTSDTYSASFVITPAPAVAVEGPAGVSKTSCDYAAQTDVDAAFAAWIAAFKVKEDGCGILAQTDLSKLTAPNICTGGTVAVKFDANDKCTSDTYSASFVITPAPAVAVEGPAGVSKTSCDYAAQTDVDAAFAAWIAAFKVKEDGCGILAQTDLSKLTAPNICTGGTVAVKFDANDKCTSDTYSASFVITPAPAVAVEGPAGVSKTSCDYAAQTDVDAAFAAWIAAFKVKEDGCGILAQTDLSKLTAPNICTGGNVSITYTIADKCTSASITRSFTVGANLAPTITTVPANQTRSTNSGQCTYTADGTEFDIAATDDCGVTSVSYELSGKTTGTGSNSLSGVAFNFGETTVTWTVTDRCGLTDLAHFVVNVNKVTTETTFTVTPDTKQYSDLVTFKATVTPYNCSTAGDAAASVTFKVGSQTMGTVTLVNGVAEKAYAMLEPTTDNVFGSGEMSPDVKTATAVFNENPDFIVNDKTASLTINPEDASVTYNGGTYFGANPNSGDGTISLSAYVLDAEDGNRGDIRNANVTFHDGTVSASSIGTANIPVGLVSTNTWEGSAGTDQDYTLNTNEKSGGGKTWTVWTTVNNYYNGTSEDATPVTLAMPGADYVTGGGNIIVSNSYGTYPGLSGKKMNFGLTMKWNKSGKNLQGNVNIIYRGMYNGQLVNFQIKSNAINSLAVVSLDANGRTTSNAALTVYKMATISTKANFQVIYPDGSTTSLGGNQALLVTAYESVIDKTGKSDKIAVQLSPSSGSGMVFSSNWSGGKTVDQLLNGGKIQAMDAATGLKAAELTTKNVSSDPTLKAFPNPFTERLNIEFSNATDTQATLEIYSITGAKLETLFNGPVEGGVLYKVEYVPNLVSSQMVLYKLTMDGKNPGW